jgi:hypothetical protein
MEAPLMSELDTGSRPAEDILRLLADPAHEVLLARRPAFSQVAAVPLLGVDSFVAAERSDESAALRSDSRPAD